MIKDDIHSISIEEAKLEGVDNLSLILLQSAARAITDQLKKCFQEAPSSGEVTIHYKNTNVAQFIKRKKSKPIKSSPYKLDISGMSHFCKNNHRRSTSL